MTSRKAKRQIDEAERVAVIVESVADRKRRSAMRNPVHFTFALLLAAFASGSVLAEDSR